MELFPDDPPRPARRPTGAPAERGVPTADHASTPLPERLRPRTLEEFVGQEHLLGPGRPLRPVLERTGRLHSLIFWGPPGSGKTTLARLLAERAGLHWMSLSAVQAGVRELREAIREAEQRLHRGVRTALFVDEIHRFNKAQQDALLPHVERGTVTLIGATTENPSFEVIPALRSRARIYTLRAHGEPEIRRLLERALADPERGIGRPLVLEDDAVIWIARYAQGDGRRALQLLERASEGGAERIDRAALESAIETRLPDYDKAGDAHYDVISAFIKSLRGSDADAAVYWLARMLEGGEDPRFIARRMIIFAAEDIGNADPHALPLAIAAAEAFDRIGLPEGRIPLAQAVTYLASAPKSNASYLAIGSAAEAVREHGALPVPLHLRNAPTALMRREGHGAGYVYPHDRPDHFALARYLPDALAGARFYLPSAQGAEADIARLTRERWGDAKPTSAPSPDTSPRGGSRRSEPEAP
jgi:putative ATPase